jgi:hypothetical protein
VGVWRPFLQRNRIRDPLEVKRKAALLKIEPVIVPTANAISALPKPSKGTNALLHLTC